MRDMSNFYESLRSAVSVDDSRPVNAPPKIEPTITSRLMLALEELYALIHENYIVPDNKYHVITNAAAILSDAKAEPSIKNQERKRAIIFALGVELIANVSGMAAPPINEMPPEILSHFTRFADKVLLALET